MFSTDCALLQKFEFICFLLMPTEFFTMTSSSSSWEVLEDPWEILSEPVDDHTAEPLEKTAVTTAEQALVEHSKTDTGSSASEPEDVPPPKLAGEGPFTHCYYCKSCFDACGNYNHAECRKGNKMCPKPVKYLQFRSLCSYCGQN